MNFDYTCKVCHKKIQELSSSSLLNSFAFVPSENKEDQEYTFSKTEKDIGLPNSILKSVVHVPKNNSRKGGFYPMKRREKKKPNIKEEELLRNIKDIKFCSNCLESFYDIYEDTIKKQKNLQSIYLEEIEKIEKEENKIQEEEDDEAQRKIEDELILQLKKQIGELTKKKRKLLEEEKKLKKNEEVLKEDEKKYWTIYFNVMHRLKFIFNERNKIKKQEKFIKEEIKKMKSSADQTIFRIEIGKECGRINGLRVGLRGNVQWNEINAGLGLICLLIMYICQRIDYELPDYELIPEGSYSEIRSKETGSTYFLYYKESQIVDLEHLESFNKALCSLLKCLDKLQKEIEFKKYGRRISSKDLPFTINREHKIKKNSQKSYSIKYSHRSKHEFTEALKLILELLQSADKYACKCKKMIDGKR